MHTAFEAHHRASWLAVVVLASCGPYEPEPVGPEVSSCLLGGCHAQVENIHYGGPRLACVDCHLGDDTDPTKEGAHVTVDVSFNPSTPGKQHLAEPSLRELDALDLDIIQFLNPSDYRVAMRACGSGALGGAGCHPNITEDSLLMTRATLAGQLSGGPFIAGITGREGQYGVVAAVDPYTPATLEPGAVASLAQFPESAPAGLDAMAAAFFPVFEQQCLECHLYQDGPHEPGLYYSSGCNGCHMVTANDARARTADVTQDIDELGHVETHRFTNLIPDEQCAHCHISHLGRSLLAQGVRERSEPEGDEHIGGPNRGVEDPEDHEPWGEENYVRHQGKLQIYGKPYPFFIEDEDGTNDIDETPPDVHTEAGLGCIDCHNIREAHGGGSLPDQMDAEIDVRCESCHGRPGEVGSLRSDAGLPFTRSMSAVGGLGENPPVFTVADDGRVSQQSRFTGLLHPVTQITERTDSADPDYNPRTRMGCELHAGSAEARAALRVEVNTLAALDPAAVAVEFPGLPAGATLDMPQDEADGRLECFACHNTWTVNCYGCHMVRDDRNTYTSRLTGEEKRGRVDNYGLSVVSDSLAMGFNARGRITPMVGTSIFFTHIDEQGSTRIDAMPLTDADGVAGAGNVHNPAHHHTVQQAPRDCVGCHPAADGSHDEPALLTAVGLGSGRFTFVDGTGAEHLLDQLVVADYDGDGAPDDPVVSGLPVGVISAVPVVSTTHHASAAAPAGAPPPGPLDAETINRVLENPVVNQRAP